MNRAVFLDRDGTINKEVNYLYKPEEFEFIVGTIDAIKIFHELGYKVIVITNQAGVARGYYKEDDVQILHNYINGLLEDEGTYIDAYYYCPHHPEGNISEYAISCDCRKPNTKLIDRAAEDFHINLSQSIIVGDKELDVLAGKNSGIGKCFLVRSGHTINETSTVADEVYVNTFEVAKALKNKEITL